MKTPKFIVFLKTNPSNEYPTKINLDHYIKLIHTFTALSKKSVISLSYLDNERKKFYRPMTYGDVIYDQEKKFWMFCPPGVFSQVEVIKNAKK